MENLFQIRLKKFLQQIEKEFRLVGIYYKKSKFACYSDGLFTYKLKHQNTIFEISFIADDTLLDKLTCKELLELKRIEFYQVRIFSDNMELISDLSVVKDLPSQEDDE
ncbi:hypothetical protein UFOVP584_51 [uncultured Caudovirales phage]|uniref:Uncharacterized protein n=1 Tax=uncultured Caudovirales phage TaxID=2100421 RepID=A0A6J5N0F4_9CAUD|nr:hypothetical protein UFOVP304_24 [uncultured Caudovirales phage]CAB4152102.1 hypothetical protein UFOVP584_51 [uncultured Caudovirales phage]